MHSSRLAGSYCFHYVQHPLSGYICIYFFQMKETVKDKTEKKVGGKKEPKTKDKEDEEEEDEEEEQDDEEEDEEDSITNKEVKSHFVFSI